MPPNVGKSDGNELDTHSNDTDVYRPCSPSVYSINHR